MSDGRFRIGFKVKAPSLLDKIGFTLRPATRRFRATKHLVCYMDARDYLRKGRDAADNKGSLDEAKVKHQGPNRRC